MSNPLKLLVLMAEPAVLDKLSAFTSFDCIESEVSLKLDQQHYQETTFLTEYAINSIVLNFQLLFKGSLSCSSLKEGLVSI